jgi:thiamine-phosphate pyrophosphorylase
MTEGTDHPIHFKLYVITDRTLCAPRPLYDVLHELLDHGVHALQLREKNLSDSEFMRLAQPIAKLCRAYSAQLFINSRLKLAVDLGAAGVHLPENSGSVDALRRASEKRLLIGCSVHTLDAAKKRAGEGADFITYSPIFLTASKPGYGPAVGVDNLGVVAKAVNCPVFALGGVTPVRVSACTRAGAHGVAVMSGILSPKEGAAQAQAYLRALRSTE